MLVLAKTLFPPSTFWILTDDWWLLLNTNDDCYERRLFRMNESVYHFHVGRWVICCCCSLFLSPSTYLHEWMNQSINPSIDRSSTKTGSWSDGHHRNNHHSSFVFQHSRARNDTKLESIHHHQQSWWSWWSPPPTLLHMHMVHHTEDSTLLLWSNWQLRMIVLAANEIACERKW